MATEVNITDLNTMIKEYAANNIKAGYPEIDTSPNSPIQDIIIKPLAKVFEPIIEAVNVLEFTTNLDNARFMTKEELDKLIVGNYAIPRKLGDVATGEEIFNFNYAPETGLSVPEGVVVKTKNGLSYIVSSKVDYTFAELSNMYNPSTFLYEVPAPIRAENVGSEYNVGEEEITIIDKPFSPYLVSVTNKVRIDNGSDDEDNVSYANRVKQYYVSRHLGTAPGYEQYIYENFPEVTDVYVVGKNHPLMTRDIATIIIDGNQYEGHIGGKTDIYLRGYKTEIKSHTIVCKSNILPLSEKNIIIETIVVHGSLNPELDLEFSHVIEDEKITITVPEMSSYSVIQWEYGNEVSVTYSYIMEEETLSRTDTFKIDEMVFMPECPIIDVISINNTTTGEQYNITELNLFDLNYISKDNLKGTSREQAQIKITKSNIKNGDSIEINYSHNSTIAQLGEIFDAKKERIVTKDSLFKTQIPIYIMLGMKIKLKDGQDPDTIKESTIRSLLINFYNDMETGSRIEESDIVGEIYTSSLTNSFIEYIELPLTTFHKTTDSQETYQDGIRDNNYLQLSTIEYPVLQYCKITWI